MISGTTEASPTATCMSLFRAPAELDSIRFFRSAVAAVLEREGADSPRSFGIMLALSEAITNAIEHGSRMGAEVEVAVVCEGVSTTIHVLDHGSDLEPLEMPDQPVAPPGSSIRGRGLLIINAIADSVSAETTGGGTRLSMVFGHAATPPV